MLYNTMEQLQCVWLENNRLSDKQIDKWVLFHAFLKLQNKNKIKHKEKFIFLQWACATVYQIGIDI